MTYLPTRRTDNNPRASSARSDWLATGNVTFTLRATPDCLVGNYQGIVLDVTVAEGGQSVRQLSGNGLLRIDAERGAKPTPK